jgi:hypothetical protein
MTRVRSGNGIDSDIKTPAKRTVSALMVTDDQLVRDGRTKQ